MRLGVRMPWLEIPKHSPGASLVIALAQPPMCTIEMVAPGTHLRAQRAAYTKIQTRTHTHTHKLVPPTLFHQQYCVRGAGVGDQQRYRTDDAHTICEAPSPWPGMGAAPTRMASAQPQTVPSKLLHRARGVLRAC